MNLKALLVSTFGNCENSSHLLTRIGTFFEQNGYVIAAPGEEPDIIVINTCGVDRYREETALDTINSYMELYKGKRLIVTGCLVKILPDLQKDDRFIAVPPKEVEAFNELFPHSIPIQEIVANKLNPGQYHESKTESRDMYYINICQGCRNNCSYCAIKKAKGFVTSKPTDLIVSEFKNGINSGARHISFLADDCGSYGLDFKSNFGELATALEPFLVDDLNLYLHYFEPLSFIELLPKIPREILKRSVFLHIPIQSSSSRILGLMNRRYEMPDVLSAIKEVRRVSPSIRICTNIIFCFPTETREEFEAHFELKKDFDTIIFYCYSPRERTAAAGLEGRISNDEIMYRIKRVEEEAKQSDRIVLAYQDLSEVGLADKKNPDLFFFKHLDAPQ